MDIIAVSSVIVILGFFLWARKQPSIVQILAWPGFAIGTMGIAIKLWGDDILESGHIDRVGLLVWREANIQTGSDLFAITSMCMLTGIVFGTLFARVLRLQAPSNSTSSARRVVASRTGQKLLLLIGAVALLFFITIYGLENILDRERYDAARALPKLASLAGPLVPVAAVTFSYGTLGPSRKLRGTAWFVLVLTWLVTFGTTSRMLALIPLLYLMVRYLLGVRSGFLRLAVCAVTALWGSSLALNFRNYPDHGLYSYIKYMDLSTFAINKDGVLDSLINILFAVPLSGAVKYADSFNMQAFWISIDPGLGATSGWSSVSRNLRIHSFIPNNAIGELASISTVFLIIVIVFLSTLISYMANSSISRANVGFSLILVSLNVLFAVLLLQYNLRSSMRVIYAMIIMAIIWKWVFPIFSSLLRSSSTRQPLKRKDFARAQAFRDYAR